MKCTYQLLQDASRTHPRFPGPHEDARRPRGHQRAPCQGPQASGLSPGAAVGVGDAVGADTRAVALRHLRTRDQFQALLSERPVARTAHFVLHCLRPELADAALRRARGFPAPLKSPGSAPWCPSVGHAARSRAMPFAARIYAVTGSLQPPLAGRRTVRLRAAFAPAQFPSASSAALKCRAR